MKEVKVRDDWHKNVYKKARIMTRLERDEWRNIRKAVLERDYYTCIRCLKTAKNGRGLSAHHLVPRGDGGEDNLNNLVTLCNGCHDFVELNDLRTIFDIEASAEDPIMYSEPKPINEHGETFDRPDWHAWVYGGMQNPILHIVPEKPSDP
jgi:hypothetical protein